MKDDLPDAKKLVGSLAEISRSLLGIIHRQTLLQAAHGRLTRLMLIRMLENAEQPTDDELVEAWETVVTRTDELYKYMRTEVEKPMGDA